VKTTSSKLSANYSPQVDAYIAKAPEFAQPVLTHLRELVHSASPEIEETVKWSRPFFVHRGVLIATMAAFTRHCGFGFWGAAMGDVLRADGIATSESSGSFGKLTRVEDLPKDKILLGYLRQAIALAESGSAGSSMTLRSTTPKAPIAEPEEFISALKSKQGATAAYASLSPSCKREYLEWIVEAKRAETKQKRIATAVEWIAEGKKRHWKHQG
jgi:uncharacterized protein YdeI (YjbR/CyaY-like superfamily)